ncbi:MAG: hypothetical protein AB7H92_04155 [Microbacteriaceae bacterium]
MAARELTFIDDRVLLACAIDEAAQLLGEPIQVADWFRAVRTESSTTIRSPIGNCVLERTHERCNTTDQVLTLDGNIGDVAVHAHLTLMAVVHSIADGRIRHGTEIWVHAELSHGSQTRRAARIISSAIGHGLEHIRLELDAFGADSQGPHERT